MKISEQGNLDSMKFLHIIPNLSKGGAERMVTDIVRELNKNSKVEVHLVLFREQIEYDIDDIQNIVHIIPSSVQLSLRRKNKVNIAELQAFIQKFQPDVIHSHLFEAEMVSRSCQYPKAKWFSHCHDNMLQFKNLKPSTLISKIALTNYFEKQYLFQRYRKNGGNRFIAISKDTERYFLQTAPSCSVHLLHNAIDYAKFYRPLEKDKQASEVLKIINVGSFVRKKNQLFLLQIAEQLKTRDLSFEIHFLGDGAMRAELENKSKELNIQSLVHFHGNVNNVEWHLKQADIYLHTAHYEPLGLVLLEAMAAGLPVISLDGKGNRDLIEEGKNGFMIFEENPKLFIEKILLLRDNPQEYKRISHYAQNFASRFDIKSYVSKLLALYAA